MPLSLHAAFVPSALQMIGVARDLVGKAESWCEAEDCSEADLIGARVHPDMLPFAYQVKSVAAHTAGAIEGLRAGVFSPDVTDPPADFAGLRRSLDDAEAKLEATSVDELEGRIGAPMRFAFRDFAIDFTAEDFLLSFSQPNFYFHAATAYDILRMKGVPLGKRDFMGKLRVAA